ncbi:MAG: LemA family protein [Gammaproteobacteria bacterium 39-13]|nr:LemA family protein [Gammaproteobacteria bacterium]OJV88499.1 MAG: LemA family protein [Gammaproteobacteria bacterium 39-13]
MHISPQLINYALIGGGILILVYFIVVYNNLISLKNNVKKAWANIDVLLKQRHDELPKLIETCKQYMQYERETLEKITQARQAAMEARAKGDVIAMGQAESVLRGSLGNLFALAENYPQLKTNETFAHLQTRISGLENTIADRRELYNESVTLNNIRIEQFPDVLVAKIFAFKHFEPLEFSASELTDVDMNAHFKK